MKNATRDVLVQMATRSFSSLSANPEFAGGKGGIRGDMSGVRFDMIRPRKSGEIIPCNFKLHGLDGLTTGKQAHKLHKIACR